MTPPPQPASATAIRERRRAQVRRRRRRWGAAVTVLAAVGTVGGAWWWLDQRPAGSEAAVGPGYVEVAPGSYEVTVPAPGTLQAATTAELRTVASGTVTYAAALGDRVTVGDTVARLDPSDLERDLREAELALERSERAATAARADRVDAERSLTNAVDDAERRLQRAQDDAADAAAKLDLTTRLAGVGGASPRELDDARAAHATALEDVAEAERALATARGDLDTRLAEAERDLADAVASVEQAQVKLERAASALAGATLIAPFDGVVSEVRVAAGGFAGSNATVLTLADDRRLELVAQVDETEISQIEVGQSARVTVMALANRSVPASVIAVAPGARTSQNIPVFEIVLGIDNPDGALRPGMTGEAEVVVRQEEDTVTLPAAAVTRNPRGDGVVAVLLDDGETERRQVEVVATVGASLVVRGELPAGTRVEIPGASPTATTTGATPGVLPSTPMTRELVPGVLPAPGMVPGSGAGRGGGGGGGQ